MNTSSLFKTKEVLLHFLFWVGVWFFYAYFFGYQSASEVYTVWFATFLLPVTMATAYFFIYYLLPRYLLRRRYLLFGLYTIYTVIVSVYFIIFSIFGALILLSDFSLEGMPSLSRNFVFITILVYLIVGLVSFLYILKYNFDTLQENKALENKILATQLQLKKQELTYLKRQLQPHFLFNTLNTIYGFALQQSPKTPDIILKLSELLDYILYQVQQPLVSIEAEVKHLQSYITLEKMRFEESLSIHFKTNFLSKNIQIPPLLLLPFVENAFKHGAMVDGVLQVFLDLKSNDTQLFFTIKNTYTPPLHTSSKLGIGLENIRKRLDLLYPNAYDLEVKRQEEWFEVHLFITKLKNEDL